VVLRVLLSSPLLTATPLDWGTIGSTQSREVIGMAPSLDIHRVAFITRSAKHQSDTRWLIAYFLNRMESIGTPLPCANILRASPVASSSGMGARLGLGPPTWD
jgi:hypothetical protein